LADRANFATVPAAKGARTGQLPEGSEMEVDIRIPPWREMAFLPSAGLCAGGAAAIPSPSPPWPEGWSQPTVTATSFSAYWAVLGVPFWEDKGSRQNPSRLNVEVKVSSQSFAARETNRREGGLCYVVFLRLG
jgi:hypothetical protein